MNYAKLYEFGCLQLKAADISDYRQDAKILLEFVCGTTTNDLYVNGTMEVAPDREAVYKELLAKRAEHIPVQHLTGTQWFMGLEFKVNEHVLIPRQDTETLVEEVMKDLHDGMRILDMCTGSGCILLSLLHYSNNCTGIGADISAEALKVARSNGAGLGVEADFVESDLFSNVSGKFDILVSNPPYIRTCEIEELMPEVRDHDPFLALNGHESGIYFYEKIINQAAPYLYTGSLVAFEIGNDQGREVANLMEASGYGNVQVIKDLCGNDRVVKGYFRG